MRMRGVVQGIDSGLEIGWEIHEMAVDRNQEYWNYSQEQLQSREVGREVHLDLGMGGAEDLTVGQP